MKEQARQYREMKEQKRKEIQNPSRSEMPKGRKELQKAFNELEPSSLLQSQPLTLPIFQCFNWNDIFEKYAIIDNMRFYVVIFRSVRRKDADEIVLRNVDAAAHEEAQNSGELLWCWPGSMNARRECFSACIWASRDAAERASRLPAHNNAMKITDQLFHSYIQEKYWLSATPDSLAAFELIGRNSSN